MERVRKTHAAALETAADNAPVEGVSAMRFAAASATVLLSAFAMVAPLRAETATQVMIVGLYHMSNPGHDMHDVHADDVLAPERQAEIQAIADGIARFHPTVIDVEWDAATVTDRYPKYLAGILPPSHNEVVQLGFRLAKMEHASINGIDVDGDFPYDPVDAYAKAHGQSALLAASDKEIGDDIGRVNAILAKGAIADALRVMNDPVEIAHGNDFYRTTLKVGSGTTQPGADLLTAWYKRNFYICANLIQHTHPGDRVVVFYGSGHAFLLRQCVGETPGFALVEPNPYLPK
ncbi:MAG: DUF5694 domain-containing protein [Rhizomicrobium sp.]